MIDLSELFSSSCRITPRYTPLAWVAELLRDFAPAMLLVANCSGQLLAVHIERGDLTADDARQLAGKLLEHLRARKVATFTYTLPGDTLEAFGIRLPCETLGTIFGGLSQTPPHRNGALSRWENVLETCGKLVWAIVEKSAEADRALARKEQFRQQCLALERAYSQLFGEITREQENRLRQAQEYSLRLEREVEARSIALKEAAETAARQAEQLRTYAAALEQALIAHEQLTEAAEAANRAKSEFLANISHELRTPLTAILGHADLLAEQLPPHSVEAHSMEVIRRNGSHLLAIINDLLDLAKAEAGRLDLEVVPVCPRDLVEQVRQLMSVRAEEKGLPLLAEYHNLPPAVLTDPTRVKQILLNLVGNAIKFTEKGQVLIRAEFIPTESHSGQLVLEVADTGIGIAPETLERLFRPFEQGHSSIARRFGGTGLGLAICKRLCELLGGSIEAESTPQVGSTFRVRLPVEITHTAPREELPAGSGSPTSLPRLQGRVLVVDDSPDNRLILQRFLELAGAEVILATNGREAVEIVLAPVKILRPEVAFVNSPSAVEAEIASAAEDIRGALATVLALPGMETISLPQPHIDLILMDLQMPEMDGLTATQILRAKGCTIPIMALTACTSAEDRQECLRRGFDGFITKPIDRAQFLTEVARFLASPDQ